MPKGAKPAPPQQSKLEEAWGSKRKRAVKQEHENTEQDPVEAKDHLSRASSAAPPVQDPTIEPETSLPSTAGTSFFFYGKSIQISITEEDKPPQVKKRRIVDSESEDEASSSVVSKLSEVTTTKAAVAQRAAKTDKKGKGKGRQNAPVVEDAVMEEDVKAQDEAAPSENDEIAEDEPDDGEDELEEDEDLANEK